MYERLGKSGKCDIFLAVIILADKQCLRIFFNLHKLRLAHKSRDCFLCRKYYREAEDHADYDHAGCCDEGRAGFFAAVSGCLM